ncbi:MAG: CBS domain-containing protein [Symbiobacteriaceae bacterium]|nr:CBS domain-containing protein [Symbiobacteriaceae bacterium]
MYCKDIMIDRKEVISVTSDFTLSKAIDRMDLYGHRTLPVVNYGRYIGVIDKYQIFERIYVKRDVDLDKAVVSDVMRTNIQRVFGSEFIERAAVAFYNQRYQFVPVIMDDTEDQFMGIIPISTLMDIFASSLGLYQPAHRLSMELTDYRGELAKITRALTQSGANLSSFVTVQHKEASGVHGSHHIQLIIKFEGDLERALSSVRSQGAVVTHIDRYEGKSE